MNKLKLQYSDSLQSDHVLGNAYVTAIIAHCINFDLNHLTEKMVECLSLPSGAPRPHWKTKLRWSEAVVSLTL